MAERLDDGAGRAARSDQVLWRSMTQFDDALAQDNAAGRPIGEIGALGRELRRQTEEVCRTRAGDLDPRARLTCQGLRDIIGRRRKRSEFRVKLGKVVQASRQTAQPAALRQAGQGLVDGGASGQIEEVAGREDTSESAGAGTLHDPIRNRCGNHPHLSENKITFSDVQGERTWRLLARLRSSRIGPQAGVGLWAGKFPLVGETDFPQILAVACAQKRCTGRSGQMAGRAAAGSAPPPIQAIDRRSPVSSRRAAPPNCPTDRAEGPC